MQNRNNGTKTIKWGIIGCGNVTETKSGPAYSKTDGFELFAAKISAIEDNRSKYVCPVYPQFGFLHFSALQSLEKR